MSPGASFGGSDLGADVANWRKTKTTGIYVAHKRHCPAFAADDGRCRCEPSWRGRRRHPVTGKPEWQQPVTKDRSEVLSWLAASHKGAAYVREKARAARTFESIGDEWLAGVAAGRIGRRKRRGKPYSDTTIAGYRTSYRNFLRPEFGPMVADENGEIEWQMWSTGSVARACHAHASPATSPSRRPSTPGRPP
jgi:hypothetical protein